MILGILFCIFETSLWIVCSRGHLDVAKILLEAGGEAPLLKTESVASKILLEAGGEAPLLKTERKDGASCLHMACQNGSVEVSKALIMAGGEALLLITAIDGFSCLIACQHGHLEKLRSQRL
jgi:hypothetical protein